MKLITPTAAAAILFATALAASATTQLAPITQSIFTAHNASQSASGSHGEGFIYGGYGPYNDSR